jgi:hypothetical protein
MGDISELKVEVRYDMQNILAILRLGFVNNQI